MSSVLGISPSPQDPSRVQAQVNGVLNRLDLTPGCQQAPAPRGRVGKIQPGLEVQQQEGVDALLGLEVVVVQLVGPRRLAALRRRRGPILQYTEVLQAGGEPREVGWPLVGARQATA